MEIIPVIDLKNGCAVQAVKGQRETYAPVESSLTNSTDLLDIGRALLKAADSKNLYLADLDAITSQSGISPAITGLATGLKAEPGVGLWLDAGAGDPAMAREILKAGATRAIVCSEVLESAEDLDLIAISLSGDDTLFSLDIKGDRVLTARPDILKEDPIDALLQLEQKGFSAFILMTLDQVGTGQGPAWGLLEQARKSLPKAFLAAAGGVRDIAGIRQLAELDIDAVLVATSLHRGWVTLEQILEMKASLNSGA